MKPQWRMKTWKVGVVIVVVLPALVRALLILLQGSVVVDEGPLQVSEVSEDYYIAHYDSNCYNNVVVVVVVVVGVALWW